MSRPERGHLVLAKLNDPTLLQQAARTAVLDAETRAGGLRETDLKDFAEEEATRLRQVLALLTEPQAKAGGSLHDATISV